MAEYSSGFPILQAPGLMGRSTYARKLQDAAFWQPYVDHVLRRHNLPQRKATVGASGTFPTFLVGPTVVKFLGQHFDGAECFQIERSLYTRTLPMLRAVVPGLVAHGHLFETGWPWPYIVTTRLAGTAWRQTGNASADWKPVVAGDLGSALREVHQLDCPDEPVWHRDVLGALLATCATRHRRRHVPPEFLIEQIDEYLAPPSAECCLVHADLHGDHIFVRDGHWPELLIGVMRCAVTPTTTCLHCFSGPLAATSRCCARFSKRMAGQSRGISFTTPSQ